MALLQIPDWHWWISQGAGVALAVFVITLWRVDRKEARERYEKITQNLIVMIENNTRAMTQLTDLINQGVTMCPYKDQESPPKRR